MPHPVQGIVQKKITSSCKLFSFDYLLYLAIVSLDSWTVDWGDGTKDIGHHWAIGGYGVNHLLPCTTRTTYTVRANYCSDPDDRVEDRCCDFMQGSVTVPSHTF